MKCCSSFVSLVLTPYSLDLKPKAWHLIPDFLFLDLAPFFLNLYRLFPPLQFSLYILQWEASSLYDLRLTVFVFRYAFCVFVLIALRLARYGISEEVLQWSSNPVSFVGFTRLSKMRRNPSVIAEKKTAGPNSPNAWPKKRSPDSLNRKARKVF